MKTTTKFGAVAGAVFMTVVAANDDAYAQNISNSEFEAENVNLNGATAHGGASSASIVNEGPGLAAAILSGGLAAGLIALLDTDLPAMHMAQSGNLCEFQLGDTTTFLGWGNQDQLKGIPGIFLPGAEGEESTDAINFNAEDFLTGSDSYQTYMLNEIATRLNELDGANFFNDIGEYHYHLAGVFGTLCLVDHAQANAWEYDQNRRSDAQLAAFIAEIEHVYGLNAIGNSTGNPSSTQEVFTRCAYGREAANWAFGNGVGDEVTDPSNPAVDHHRHCPG